MKRFFSEVLIIPYLWYLNIKLFITELALRCEYPACKDKRLYKCYFCERQLCKCHTIIMSLEGIGFPYCSRCVHQYEQGEINTFPLLQSLGWIRSVFTIKDKNK